MIKLEEKRLSEEHNLSIMEETIGKQTYYYAMNLDKLATLNQHTGRLKEARQQYEEALGILEATIGKQSDLYAIALSNFANLNQRTDRLEEARQQYEEALGILEAKVAKLTESDTFTLFLASLNQDTGSLEEGRLQYEKVLAEVKKSYATILGSLASLNASTGRLDEARQQYEDALRITEATVGKQTDSYASALSGLANLNQRTDRLDEARQQYEDALRITEDTVGKQTDSYATTLHNLAFLNQKTGRLKKARQQDEEALGRLEEARQQYEEALHIKEATVGKQTDSYGSTLHNLALLNYNTGRLEEARQQYEEALHITEATVGKQTNSYANTLYNFALLEVKSHRPLEALKLMKEAAVIYSQIIGQIFKMSSEQQRLNYLQQEYYKIEVFLSLVSQHLPNNQEAIQSAFELVLQRKALATEASLIQRLALLSGKYPHLTPKLTEMKEVAEQIAQQTWLIPENEQQKAIYQERFASLQTEYQKLDSEISSQIPEMNLQKQIETANRRAVALALPENTTLVEFVRFQGTNFQELTSETARYLAFILTAGKPDEIHMIDLGDADNIDKLISVFRTHIISEGNQENYDRLPSTQKIRNQNDPTPREELSQKLFQPLQPYLTKQLLIAPDGDINQLPLEILPDLTSHHKLLIDEYKINYLTVGRDAIRFANPIPATSTLPLVIANPDYNLGAENDGEVNINNNDLSTTETLQIELCRDIKESTNGELFTPLPGSQIEGETIAPLLGAKLYTDINALKTIITKVSSPLILHLSTHGYFLRDNQEAENKPNQKINFTLNYLQKLTQATQVNPLLKSGLAFAGINTFLKTGKLQPDFDDGLISAQDTLKLDLFGTELVVTSACQTALGEIEIGQGVTGLRRAFIQAGAKTLIMSLWAVNDVSTTIFMQKFYHYLLKANLPKAEALLKAKLDLRHLTVGEMRSEWLTEEAIAKVKMRNEEISKHLRELSQKSDNYRPYEPAKYWSAFICIGDIGVFNKPENLVS